MLKKIIELGDKKHVVSPEDLPYVIADVLKTPEEHMLRVEHYRVMVATGEAPAAEVTLSYRGDVEKAEASGDGGYDAFMQALKKAARVFDLELPTLHDYKVRIPPGGRTGALVETTVTWRRELPVKAGARPSAAGSRPSAAGSKGSFETFITIGVDPDQLAAAVIATEKMLNAIAPAPAKRSRTRTTRKTPRGRKTAAGGSD